MPSGIKISSELEAKILELRSQGKTHIKIASELGISGSPIRRILNPEAHEKIISKLRTGPSKFQGREIPLEVKAGAIKLREQGKSYGEIRSELFIGRKAMQRIFDPEARERAEERQRQLRATTARVEINGKKVRVKVDREKPRPKACELCHKEAKRFGLNWHHWEDTNPGIGLWLCNFPCHGFVEGVDVGLKAEDYLRLKDQANRGGLK